MVDALAEKLGKDPSELKVWLEHEDSVYGSSIAERQKERLEEAGVQVVGVGEHSAKSIDLTDSILRAKDAAPDIYIQTGYVPDGNLLLRTARDQGFEPLAMVFVGTGDTAETLEAMGSEGVEGLFVVSYPRPEISDEYGPARTPTSKPTAQSTGKIRSRRRAWPPMSASRSWPMPSTRPAAPTRPRWSRRSKSFDEPLQTYATGFGAKFDENKQNVLANPTVIQWQDGKQMTVFPEAAAGDAAMKVGG